MRHQRSDYSISRLREGGAVALLLLLGALCGSGCGTARPEGLPSGPGPDMGGSMPPPGVVVANITEEEIDAPVEYVGRVEGVQSVDLVARVQGYLEEIRFEEGADVNAGDVLYVIEQAQYRIAVDAALADIAKAEANLEYAEQYRQRLESVRSGAISKDQLEAAASSESQARAALDQCRTALDQAELNLAYTTIEAPIRGRMGRTLITKGNLVGPSTGTLSRLVQLDPIRVVFSISENDLLDAELESGSSSRGRFNSFFRIEIRLPNGQTYPANGKIDFFDNEIDPETGTIPVRAVYRNSKGLLLPGQYVTVVLRRGRSERKPVVPQSAVQEDNSGRYVFVVDGEMVATLRRVRTGLTAGTRWVVEDGLEPGETVIVQGVQKVRSGQTVNPVFQEQPGGEG